MNEETLKDKFQTTNNLEILEGETFKLELQNNSKKETIINLQNKNQDNLEEIQVDEIIIKNLEGGLKENVILQKEQDFENKEVAKIDLIEEMSKEDFLNLTFPNITTKSSKSICDHINEINKAEEIVDFYNDLLKNGIEKESIILVI